jgi:hypothetical protein
MATRQLRYSTNLSPVPHSIRSSPAWTATLVLALCSANTTAQPPSTSNCGIVPAIASVPANARFFRRDPAAADDTGAIQSSLDALRPGDWLVFPAGTYKVGRHLSVSSAGATLIGNGVTLHFTNAQDGALVVQADNVSIYNFTLLQDSTSRQTSPLSAGIAIYDSRNDGSRTVSGTVLQGNTLQHPAQAGIFVYNANGFTVAANSVWRSWADGVHMTAGSRNGRVISNQVSQNGDDMIAVVSYAGTPGQQPAAARYANWAGLSNQLAQNIYIHGNQLSDQYLGRGISVCGGSNVTIDANRISKVPGAAGIYLTRELAWMTFGDQNILVTGNTVTEIQTSPPGYKPPGVNVVLTGHGAIEIGSTLYGDESSNPTYRSAFSVSGLQVVGNTVQTTGFAGLRMGASASNAGTAANASASASATAANLIPVPGPVSNIVVRDNTFADVRAPSVVQSDSGLDAATVSCSNNTLNGTKLASQCSPVLRGSTTMTNTVATGASLQCDASGHIVQGAAPKPPTNLRSSY